MIKFSFFKDLVNPEGEITLVDFIEKIKFGLFHEQMKKIRKSIAEGSKAEATEIKKNLPAVTPSIICSGRRNSENITAYTQIVVLDFDHIDDYDKAFNDLKNIPHTLCAFRSPSGIGIKVFIKTNGTLKIHGNTFKAAADHYEKSTGLEVDQSGKDLARLCFLSYDPDIFYNPAAQIFEVDSTSTETSKEDVENSEIVENNPFHELLEACVRFLDETDTYQEGNRNTYLFKLACLFNRFGIPRVLVNDFVLESFDLGEDESLQVISSAYKKIEEHGTMPSFFRNKIMHGRKDFNSTPFLSADIYDYLPQILKRATEVIPIHREKDMLLLGALSVFGGCIHNFKGVYGGKTVHTNVYVFVIAPPASGKGVLIQAKTLAQEYHNKLVEESKKALAAYQSMLDEHKFNQSMDVVNKPEPPVEPEQNIFFIPGNSSASAFIERMQQSKQRVMLFETEADTISASLRQDWGSYSEIMRGAFHHESVGINRKGRGGLFEMQQPRLSILISGTPSQLQGLVKSVEDGLFSRIMYYIFQEPVQWRDVSPGKDVPNYDVFYKALSLEVLEIIKFHEENETNFHFSKEQWDKHNGYFEMLTKFYGIIYGSNPNSQSVITRMGLIRYRIAMILSALRQYDSKLHQSDLTCSDLDFELSQQIAETLLHHSFIIMNMLPNKTVSYQNPAKEKFYKSLPNEFTRAEAVGKGESVKAKARTVDNYLKAFVDEGKLTKEGNGTYKKVKP